MMSMMAEVEGEQIHFVNRIGLLVGHQNLAKVVGIVTRASVVLVQELMEEE